MMSRLSQRAAGSGSLSVVRGLGAFAVLWTAGACTLSSTERAALDAGAGGLSPVVQALGGTGGGVDNGAGGAAVSGDAGACEQAYDVCIDSCARDFTASDWAPLAQVCEDGVLTCPGSTFNYASCSTTSCARHRPYCCNPTTGDSTIAPCGADGLRACAAETPETPSVYGCVPTALAASGCVLALAGQPCGEPVHNCSDNLLHCICDQPGDGGGMVWRCEFLSGIP